MPLGLIVLVILGFFWWWPLGLVLLLAFFGSRHMCWNRHAMGGYGGMGNPDGGDSGGCGWQWSGGQPHWQAKMERMQAKMDRLRARMDSFGRGDWWGSPPSSGNRAFDDYRRDTLRRLEDEQREFKEFLERLRFAKDRQEFDQFMTERRNRPSEPPQQPQNPA